MLRRAPCAKLIEMGVSEDQRQQRIAHGARQGRRSGADTLLVRIEPRSRGWEVSLADRRRGLTCATLQEARRVASALCVGHEGRCELIVCDAYHRLLSSEIIEDREDARPVSSRR